MRHLIAAALTLLLAACGVKGDQGERGPEGPAGKDSGCNDVSINKGLCKSPTTEEDESEEGEETEPLSFEGEYYLPYSGYAIINIDHEDRYTVLARYETLNPDDSLCVLTLNRRNLSVHDEQIVYGATVNMAEDNCDSDSGSKLETEPGVTYRHETTLTIDEDGLLNVHLLVFETDDGETNLVIDRELVEE